MAPVQPTPASPYGDPQRDAPGPEHRHVQVEADRPSPSRASPSSARLLDVTTLKVEVDSDHLARLVRSPMAGLVELIWNAIDADATTIAVRFNDNGLGGWQSLVVEDDGTGINLEQADLYFGRVGGSWKKTSRTSEGGRTLHGQAGQGRWASFGLGSTVRWTSVADQVTGARSRIQITGRRSDLTVFEVSDPEPVASAQEPGTIVEVFELTEAATRLADADPVEELTIAFALAIEEHHLDLSWQGHTVDPASLRARTHTAVVEVEGVSDAELVVIEWAQLKPDNRALHLCDASGVTLHTTLAGIQAPGFVFSAYLRWDGFHDHRSNLSLGDLAVEPVGELIEAAKVEMRRYFGERTTQRGSELVAAWKADDSYPYKDDATSAVEKAERELFDIVAVVAADAVEDMAVRSRKLSLRLMREALEKSPDAIHQVLQEVLDLTPGDAEELRDLLGRTTLSSLISSARRITDRLDFLMGLEELVNAPELKKRVRERSQLHRILVNETWIFREEYALTADDVSLRTALKQYINLLGRDSLTAEEIDQADVVDAHGARTVVDLILSDVTELMVGRVVEQHENRREHLVIELKRPSVSIGWDEVSQIMNYADTIAADARFDMATTRWEFWIVGDKIEQRVKGLAKQEGREAGIVYQPQELPIVVRAVTWAQIIQDARHRLSFVRDSLNYSASSEHAMEYLERAHGKFLPGLAVVPTVAPNDAEDKPVDLESTDDPRSAAGA